MHGAHAMPIRRFELERYFAQHEFEAPDVLSCSDCEPLGMDELLSMADTESAEMWRSLWLGYTESAGHSALRAEIARAYPGLDPAEVLVAAPEECIFVTMAALLSPGDHVVSCFPGYASLYEIARWIGCDVSLWRPRESEGWRFALEDLELLLRNTTRLVAVNFPHNPTGAMLRPPQFERLVERVGQTGAYLLSDEMYRGLEVCKEDRLPPACTRSERALSLSGMSKLYGLAGLRIGWLVTHDRDALQRIAEMKDYTTICPSAPSEVLAIVALRNGERILARQRCRAATNLARLTAFVDRCGDVVTWTRPSGGPVAYPRLLRIDDVDRFCRDLVEQEGMLLLPGSVFEDEGGHVRIGFGRADFPEVLDRFETILRRWMANG